MKTLDISPRLLVLMLAVLLIATAAWSNSHGGITASLAAILGSIAGSIPKMLERPSILGGSSEPPAPPASLVASDLAGPAVGALSALTIAFTLGG